MQNLILEGLQQKLQKSCSRCNKNTRHVESSYILQPPKYLLLFVNRFRYINDNVTKDRCLIPMDTTVRLGPLKFSLQATIDHHGPSIDSGHVLGDEMHFLLSCSKFAVQRKALFDDLKVFGNIRNGKDFKTFFTVMNYGHGDIQVAHKICKFVTDCFSLQPG